MWRHGGSAAGVHQPAAVDEFPTAIGHGLHEAWKILRSHGQIGVENHQDLPLGLFKAQPHRIGLPLAALAEATQLEGALVAVTDLFNPLPGVVARVPLHEDHFGAAP